MAETELGFMEFPVNQDLPHPGLGGFYFNGVHLGGISSHQGIPFFSRQGEEWILALAGCKPASLPSCPAHAPTQVTGTWDLPSRTVVDTYLSAFTTSAKRYVFPIIDEASFPDVVEKAYNGQSDQADIVCAKACVLAFTCIGVHMDGQLDMQQIEADQCAARACRLMPAVLANPSSESIQVCTMLCMYNIFAGNVAAAATYLSVAYRFASMLGAHLNPTNTGTTPAKHNPYSSQSYLRRVFWHCYMYDKDICLRAGYPSIIDDDQCDLSLPPGYKEIDDFDSFKDGTDLIPGDMRLTIIKSNTIRLLYCAKAFRTSEVDLLKHIRELDAELESWRISIPPEYRPNLVSSYRMQLDSGWNRAKQCHVLVIHFEYYFLLSLIHSASGRCRIPAFGGGDHRANVNSCQHLALQASRSTLANLSVVSQVLNSGDFWYFIQYPMSASLTIFCNILTSPLNSRAGDDLELLQRVPRLIRDMYAPTLGPGDGVRIGLVEQFVEELLRLGRSAAHKAAVGG
ncbi:fungal specific transcription factor domain-containing protein [Apiospora saccharicola]|uniref:Fungal specific transcription factor domain-containing protein n=1 Tax=Apiospora saccharicola TaxID=335842 RepID=A0ABR1VR64_9PEZI